MDFFEGDLTLKLRIQQRSLKAKSPDIALQDLILTHVIQHMSQVGALEHLVFKGGSMLRRVVFGNQARFPGDLDFSLTGEAWMESRSALDKMSDNTTGAVASSQYLERIRQKLTATSDGGQPPLCRPGRGPKLEQRTPRR